MEVQSQDNASVIDKDKTKHKCSIHWCEHPEVDAVKRRITKFYQD